MKRSFVLLICWILLLIVPGITNAANVTLQDGKMKNVFSGQTFTLAAGSGGDLWSLNDQSETEEPFVETCSGKNSEVDIGFITKYINTTNTFAHVIYIAMETKFVSNASLEIYSYNGTTQLQSTTDKTFTKYFYQNFSHVYTIQDRRANMSQIDVFKVYNNGSGHLVLAVRGIAVCARIYKIKMYYYYCEEDYFKGIKFPKTMSPAQGVKRVDVSCSVLNASPSREEKILSGYCGYCGTWNITKDKMGCFCKKGFEKNITQQCSPCKDLHFKAKPSNQTCQRCPRNSVDAKQRTSCECMQGYYHFTRNADPTTEPCFAPIEENLGISVQINLGGKSVKVTWDPAVVKEKRLRASLRYDVQCFLCSSVDDKNCNRTCRNEEYEPRPKNLSQLHVDISNLHPGRIYYFRVYPKTSINSFIKKENWNYSESGPFSMPSENFKDEQSSEGNMAYFDYVVISGIASGILFMIMVVLLIFVFKRKTECRRSQLIIGNPNLVELPEIGQKLYVDPSNYDSPEDALNEFARELDPSILILEKLIGGGEFGDVYKGSIKCKEGKSIPVAVKTLKHEHTEKNERDFLLEASVMGQFHDPNVIHLEGVITKKTPRMIVTEYMSNGSLDRFLRINDDNLTDLQLIGMARGVASGMAYLSAMNFIHRDLAARNILVNDDMLCKITDFGLSRSLETEGTDGEYATSGGKIPVRWTAPEAIAYRKFSSSSDVWSFGILLWEIMSFGDRPYWEWDNYKVLKEVEVGFRLPPPENCPRAAHELMLLCWNSNRNERPKFQEITQIISQWIRSPETMYDHPNSAIGDWLQSIKMGDYASLFLAVGYESPYQLTKIRNEDLLKMGVKLIGHRNKILKAIKALDNGKTGEKVTLTRGGSIAI